MLDQYREVFLEELEEQLQFMDEGILKLEQGGESEIQGLFRAAHTLKGSSAAMGFEEIKKITHAMEHLMELVRSHKLSVTAPMIDLLFKSLDALKQLKNDIVKNIPSSYDATELIEELYQFSNERVASTADSTPPISNALSLDMQLKIAEGYEQGHRSYRLDITVSSDCAIKSARAYVIYSKLTEWAEVLSSSPDFDGIDESATGALNLSFVVLCNLPSTELQRLVSNFIDVIDVEVTQVGGEETPIAPFEEAEEKPSVKAADLPNDLHHHLDKPKSQTVRVNVERLEHLMNLVGELVIDQTRIKQVERTLNRRYASDGFIKELGQISDHLSRTIGELQESVMKARMLPIEQLFNRFPRMVRDLSRSLGKEVDLIIEGKDTELDRNLIEEIADPLIHLIRNAVDHGIESPNIREQAGKPRTGSLVIRATHEENKVVLYIIDDGAGINASHVKDSAVKKGVITKEEADQLSDREAVELIFRPGFSTANSVSDISGRGVGMDIVKSHIEKLNGLIDIDTTVGEGTQFIIRLPLTLAIIPGLLVDLNERTFIIPMSNIVEIVRVTSKEIQTVRGQDVIILRNQVIPIIELQDQLLIPSATKRKTQQQLVIVGTAERRAAIAVDELLGNQEVVIKSLGSYVGKVDGISGATILGNGNVALILEISAILRKLYGN